MRAMLIATGLLAAAALAAPGAAAADRTYRVITFDAEYLTAVDTSTIRRKGTGVTARVVHATRIANSAGSVTDYSILTVEFDCQWLKKRILAYDRYRPDGTLAQSYRDADWMGASARGERAWLCFGEGGLSEVRFPSDHALGKAFLAGTLTLP